MACWKTSAGSASGFTPGMRADALLFRFGERRLVPIDPAKVPLRLALRFQKVGRVRAAKTLFSYLQRAFRARGPVAFVKTMSFQGVASAAMVYDDQPTSTILARSMSAGSWVQ
jgi:hypothetical protein